MKADEFTMCDRECHVVQPYGFVIDEGCPIHDPTLSEEVYLKADKIAKNKKQTTGEKRDYYITLEQLQRILEDF